MRALLISGALLFGLGSCMGAKMAPDTHAEFIKVPVTKTVTESPEPAEPYPVLPKSCEQALAYAATIVHNAELMYDQGDRQLDILSDARQILAEGGNTAQVAERQIRLQGDTIGNLYAIEEVVSYYQTYMKKCEEEAP